MESFLRSTKLVTQMMRDFRHTWRELLAYEVAFQALKVWLGAPFIGYILSVVLAKSGQVAVSNHELIDFIVTPMGVLYVILFSSATAVLIVLEQAGMLAVISFALSPSPTRAGLLAGFSSASKAIWRVSRLGVSKMLILSGLLAPFLIAGIGVYWFLLTEYDIYFYLNHRPVELWIAVSVGLALTAMVVVIGTILLVNWSMALPMVVFESYSPDSALASSQLLVRSNYWSVLRVFVTWAAIVFTFTVVISVATRVLITTCVGTSHNESMALLVALVLVQFVLMAFLSFMFSTTLSLLLNRVYHSLVMHQEPTCADSMAVGAVINDDPTSWGRLRGSTWLAMALLIICPAALWGGFAHQIASRYQVLVTAHRGNAVVAPENTLIAIQKAIDVQADYVEVDVHETLDGVVVLLHDRDLKRVAGDSRRLEQLTYAEVSELDVGSWFAKDFAGERVPTLKKAIDCCRGKIRMNIELKVFGSASTLAKSVAELVREEHIERECIVTSLSYDALLQIRRFHPEVSVGLIVATSIGDPSRLDVDALSVRADHLTDQVIQAAHRRGQPVMVWGISGETQLTNQIRRGVDNLISSDPQQALELRDRWMDACDRQRQMIGLRMLLGLPPQFSPNEAVSANTTDDFSHEVP